MSEAEQERDHVVAAANTRLGDAVAVVLTDDKDCGDCIAVDDHGSRP